VPHPSSIASMPSSSAGSIPTCASGTPQIPQVASPVAQAAAELGVPVLAPRHPREPDFQAALAELRPECCPVVAYGALLPESALAIPTHGWVNLHFSLLPAWRGAAPVQAAIRAGDEITGATTFRLEEGMDTGPVFGTVTEKIADDDTAGSLLERLGSSGAGLLAATLDGIADGTLHAVPQPAEGASLAKAAASDGGRDVTASAIQAHGGVGFTWEADVHWFYKRAQVDAALLGGLALGAVVFGSLGSVVFESLGSVVTWLLRPKASMA